MLRAEAAAVLTVSDGHVRTVFAHRVDPATDWLALLGTATVERALGSAAPVGVPLAAGRWDERVAYAALVRFETLEAPAVLCVLRHEMPFDPVELSSAESAGALLAIGTSAPRGAPREREPTVDDSIAHLAGEPPRERDRPLLAIVAEGQPATRVGLRALLASAGITVVGAVASCAETIALAREARADVALVDLALPDAPGTGALARLAAAAPGLPLVAFASGRGGAMDSLAAGAAGHLSKDAPPERIVAALRAAANGLTALQREDGPRPGEPSASADPARTAVAATAAERAPGPSVPLTRRELDLLGYLAEGHTNKEIARAMVLAEDTVKKAVQAVIAKLGATDRTHAVVLALRAGLIT